jgi:hypothetical protein
VGTVVPNPTFPLERNLAASTPFAVTVTLLVAPVADNAKFPDDVTSKLLSVMGIYISYPILTVTKLIIINLYRLFIKISSLFSFVESFFSQRQSTIIVGSFSPLL